MVGIAPIVGSCVDILARSVDRAGTMGFTNECHLELILIPVRSGLCPSFYSVFGRCAFSIPLNLVASGPPFFADQPAVASEFREWLIDFGDSGYVARYHVAVDEVMILAIRHQKEAGFR